MRGTHRTSQLNCGSVWPHCGYLVLHPGLYNSARMDRKVSRGLARGLQPLPSSCPLPTAALPARHTERLEARCGARFPAARWLPRLENWPAWGLTGGHCAISACGSAAEEGWGPRGRPSGNDRPRSSLRARRGGRAALGCGGRPPRRPVGPDVSGGDTYRLQDPLLPRPRAGGTRERARPAVLPLPPGAARERAWRGWSGPGWAGLEASRRLPVCPRCLLSPAYSELSARIVSNSIFSGSRTPPRPFLIPQGSLSVRSSPRLVWKALKPVKINDASNKFTNAQRLHGVPSGRQSEGRPALPGEAGWLSQNPSGGRPEQFGAPRGPGTAPGGHRRC